jgi:hypothetical protein
VCVPAGTRNHLGHGPGPGPGGRGRRPGRLRGGGGAAHRPRPGRRPGVRQQRHRRAVRQDRPVARLPRPQGRHRPGAAVGHARARRNPVRPGSPGPTAPSTTPRT